MNLQQRTLRQYMNVKDQPSMRQIAKETGIQQTRVFRILNGARMHLDEWEIFDQAIKEHESDLEGLARACVCELSHDQLSEIRTQMKTKLEWNRMVEQTMKQA